MSSNPIILDATTNLELVKSLGELYKSYVPEHQDSPDEIGRKMQNLAMRRLEESASIGISNPVPPIMLMVDTHNLNKVIGYGLIQYDLNYHDQDVSKKIKENHISDSFSLKDHDITYQSSCYSFILVHPEYRRQGIAKTLLKHMLYYLNDHEPIGIKKSIITSIFFLSDNLACKKFLENSGGTLTEYGHTYQLHLSKSYPQFTLDDMSQKCSVDILHNPSVDQLSDFIELYNLAKQSEPTGNEERYQVQTLHTWFEQSKKVATDMYIGLLYFHETDDTRPVLVGISELMTTDVSRKIFQKFTGIHPNFRKKGYAKLLKKSIIIWLQKNITPSLPVIIETQVLDNNQAMIKVNESLGFVESEIELTIEFFRNPVNASQ